MGFFGNFKYRVKVASDNDFRRVSRRPFLRENTTVTAKVMVSLPGGPSWTSQSFGGSTMGSPLALYLVGPAFVFSFPGSFLFELQRQIPLERRFVQHAAAPQKVLATR